MIFAQIFQPEKLLVHKEVRRLILAESIIRSKKNAVADANTRGHPFARHDGIFVAVILERTDTAPLSQSCSAQRYADTLYHRIFALPGHRVKGDASASCTERQKDVDD